MWLDRRAFKRTDDLNQALGSEGVPLKVEKMALYFDCYDNSNNRQRVRNASTVYDPVSDDPDAEESESSNHDDNPGIAEPLNELQITRGVRVRYD